MGSAIGRHLHKGMALLLAAAMALSLNPAAALAQTNTATDSQGNASAYVARAGEGGSLAAEDQEDQAQKRQEDMDASVVSQQYSEKAQAVAAESTISLMTYASFRYTKLVTPADYVSVASIDDYAPLSASFEGGTPYANSGSSATTDTASPYYYIAHYTWTVNGVKSSKTIDRIYGFDTRIAEPTVTLPIADIAALSPIPSSAEEEVIVVTVQLEGGNVSTIPGDFSQFTLTKSVFPEHELTSPVGATGADVDAKMGGSFSAKAQLDYTDLMGGSTSAAAKGTLAALQELTKPNQMLAAAQLDVTNAALSTSEAMYGNISSVELGITPEVAQKLIDKGEITIGAVAGEESTITYKLTPATGQTGPKWVFQATAEGGEVLTAEVTIHPAEGADPAYATLFFPTKGLATKPGAFAITCPADATFTVNATVANGIMTNAGTSQFAQGAAVEFVMSPFEGYVIDEAQISVSGGGAGAEIIGGNTLRLTNTDAIPNGATVTVSVTFAEFQNSTAAEAFTLDVSGVNAAGVAYTDVTDGWVSISGTGKDGAAVTESTKDPKLLPGMELKPGSAVLLTFHPASDNHVVKNIWVVSSTTAASQLAGVREGGAGTVQPISLTGNEYMISSLAENTRVVVQFELGNPPATDSVTYNINGLMDGQGGKTVDTVTGAVKGTNPLVNIVAADNSLIDEVRLYEGLFSTAAEAQASGAGALIAAAAGMSSYKLVVPNINSDYTVVAKFRAAPMQITVRQADGGSLSVSGATSTGGDRYSVEPGAEVRFTATPYEGYAFTGVWANNAKQMPQGITQAGGTFTMTFTEATTIVPEFTSSKIPSGDDLVTVVVSTDGNGQAEPAGASIPRGGSLMLSFTVEGDWRAAAVNVSDGASTVTRQLDQVFSWKFDPADFTADGLKADADSYSLYVQFTEVKQPQVPVDQVQYSNITLAAVGAGAISPEGARNDAGEYVYRVVSGAEQRLTMIPAGGYVLDSVKLAQAGSELTEVTAAAPGAGGASLGVPYVDGNTLVFTPAKGATAGIDYTVLVQFKKADATEARYVVSSVVDGGHGTITPSGQSEQAAGASIEFSFMPDAGYKLESVQLMTVAGAPEGVTFPAEGTELISMVVGGKLPLTLNANMQVVAKFAADPDYQPTDPENPANKAKFTVSPQAAEGGSIAPGTDQTLFVDGALGLSFTPERGYALDTVRLECADHADVAYLNRTISARTQSVLTSNGSGAYSWQLTLNASDQAKLANATVKVYADFVAAPDQSEEFTIDLSVAGTGSGTITPGGATKDAPAQVKVAYNGSQTFSFIPDEAPEGFVNRLASVQVVAAAGGTPTTLTNVGASYSLFNVTQDYRLIAEFELVSTGEPGYEPKPTYETHTITALEAVGQGRIEPAGATTVNATASLTMRMIADEGWHLSYIIVDATANASGSTGGTTIPATNLLGSQYTFADIQADHTIQAVFVKDAAAGEEPSDDEVFTTFNITVDGAKVLANPSGTVSVKKGDTTRVVLSPTHGNTIAVVQVVDAANPSRVLATFTPSGGSTDQPFAVDLPCYPGVDRAIVQVTCGSTQQQPTPGAFYTITASVAADAQGNKLGEISPSGTQSVRAGSDVPFTLTPAAGCTVDAVTANGSPVAVQQNAGYYTFTLHGINGAVNVVAKFRQITPEESAGGTVPEPSTPKFVTIESAGAGTIEPSGVQKVAPGLSLGLTMKPSGDARLGTLVVDGVDVTAKVQMGTLGGKPVYTYTINPVNADMQVKVTFVNPDGSITPDEGQIPIDVKVNVQVSISGNVYGGCVEPGEPFTVNPGDSQTFKIKPANGYYVAEVTQEQNGQITPLQVRAWKPSYTTATRTAASQVTEVASVSAVSALLGVEQAWADEGVQMPYSAVDVDDIRQSFTLNVVFKKCSENGLPEYRYDDAAAGELDARPGVSGNGTVKPSDNLTTPDENGDKTYIIDPGVDENGDPAAIDSITIHGTTFDLTGDNVRTNGKQDPDKVVALIKNSGVLLPGEDFWYDKDKGVYMLKLHVKQVVDENGNPVVDANGNPVYEFEPPEVKFEGAGKVYSNEVRLIAVVRDQDGNVVSGGRIFAEREDGTADKDGVLFMDYGGHFDFDVELPDGDYELEGFELSGGLSYNQRSTDGTETVALQADTPNRVFVYGPGTITANIRQKAAAPGTDEPAANAYTVVASAGKGGTISNEGEHTYQVGTDAQFTFSPESSAYVLDAVKVDGQVLDGWKQYSYTFSGCKAGESHTIEVTFKAAPSLADPNSLATTGSRALRSLTSLATTGDNGYIMVLTLAALACGGLGFAIIATGRTRRKAARAVADAALTEDAEE